MSETSLQQQAPATKRRWEGYTLEQLRSQRAMVQQRIASTQKRVDLRAQQVRSSFMSPTRGMGASLCGRMIGALSYLDWIMLAFSLYKKLAPLFAKKK